MGQYYRPFIIGDHGKYHIINPHQYNNGSKLMEHSYINNSVTNAVRTLICNNPMRVAWIGDYSDSPYEDAYSKKMPYDKFMRFYKACWDEHPRKCVCPASMNYDEECKGWKLVNHDQNCYVDMDEYIAKSGHWERWNGAAYYECIDPLPLLTACGNDRGGGDFREGSCGYNDVGIWAFDKLEFTQNTYGYEKVAFSFVE